MKVRRIVANLSSRDISKAQALYQDLPGLDLLIDHGWIKTFGSSKSMSVQVSVASAGGSGTAVPELSIEVDDLSNALVRAREAGIAIEYGPADEPRDVRRFYLRDPCGKLINMLQHL